MDNTMGQFIREFILEVLFERTQGKYQLKKVLLPGFLEDMIGDWYLVNQMDMHRINENTIGQFVITAQEGARKAQQRVAWQIR